MSRLVDCGWLVVWLVGAGGDAGFGAADGRTGEVGTEGAGQEVEGASGGIRGGGGSLVLLLTWVDAAGAGVGTAVRVGGWPWLELGRLRLRSHMGMRRTNGKKWDFGIWGSDEHVGGGKDGGGGGKTNQHMGKHRNRRLIITLGEISAHMGRI